MRLEDKIIQEHLDKVDAATILRSRDVKPVDTTVLCGRGLALVNGKTCARRGKWIIAGFNHPYCTHHAAERLRALKYGGAR